MKIELQAKLLRVLEEQRVRRVGGNTEVALDVRVLAASNRDVAQAVRDGKLREDLFYRLNVLTIDLPPLRERKEDLPLLVQNFVQHYGARNNKEIVGVDEEALSALQAHPWPGNVRQLRNVIERAAVICQGRVIHRSDLAQEFQSIANVEGGYVKVRIGSTLEDMERELIARTIEFSDGNKTHAAQILGVSTKTLYNKLERYRKEGENHRQ